jgi:hypothetical protein
MKKVFVLVSCFAVVLILSKMSFSQSTDAPGHAQSHLSQSQLSVEKIVAGAASPQALPFGYPPYPTVGGYPAYGVPYSYSQQPQNLRSPRAPRRLAARLTPQPYPLPMPGATPGAATPFVPPMVAAPMTGGQVPQQQEVLGAIPATPSTGQPTVFYRPTPVKNFMTLMAAPRPYIGYDPYAGYPPFPGYAPPQ